MRLDAGLGTGLSNGCTSGHGIIGNARLSPRSITATMLFMMSAMATGTLMNTSKAFPGYQRHADAREACVTLGTPACLSL
jgi:uncharacterized membrane protein YedE/YeeE